MADFFAAATDGNFLERPVSPWYLAIFLWLVISFFSLGVDEINCSFKVVDEFAIMRYHSPGVGLDGAFLLYRDDPLHLNYSLRDLGPLFSVGYDERYIMYQNYGTRDTGRRDEYGCGNIREPDTARVFWNIVRRDNGHCVAGLLSERGYEGAARNFGIAPDLRLLSLVEAEISSAVRHPFQENILLMLNRLLLANPLRWLWRLLLPALAFALWWRIMRRRRGWTCPATRAGVRFWSVVPGLYYAWLAWRIIIAAGHAVCS